MLLSRTTQILSWMLTVLLLTNCNISLESRDLPSKWTQTAPSQYLGRSEDSPPIPGSQDWSITVDNRIRTYRVHIPRSFNSSAHLPLVIALHSGQSSGLEMEEITGLSELGERKGFICVYPNAIGLYKGKLYWNDGRVPEVDDVGFISALIDELIAKLGVDPRRIYVTGISNGASMTNRIGLNLADKIAAIAPVAGTIGFKGKTWWRRSRPVPMVYFHGTDDLLAYYRGGSVGTYRGSGLSAEKFVEWWAQQNSCKDQPQIQILPDRVRDGTHVTRISYTGCQDGADVVFYRIDGGGHTWPGGRDWLPETIGGKLSGNVNASMTMWEFFQTHTSGTLHF